MVLGKRCCPFYLCFYCNSAPDQVSYTKNIFWQSKTSSLKSNEGMKYVNVWETTIVTRAIDMSVRVGNLEHFYRRGS